MFNLVGKRYLFLIVSLIIIIPGAVSLIFKGLDVGIDFAGGSTLEFRPSQQVGGTQQIISLLDQLGLKDTQVNIGTAPNLVANQVVWIRLNTNADTNVTNTIQNSLKQKYGSQLSVIPSSFQLNTSGGKTALITVIVVSNFQQKVTPQISDIQTLLKKLPNTTNPTQTGSAAPVATATSVPSPKLTPTVTATAKAASTPNATATAAAVVTATPTTTTSSSATIPVNVTSVTQGRTIDTINILTTTATNNTTVSQVQAAFLNHYNTYLYTLDNSSVSASVAGDTIRNSIFAVIAASVLILLYVWFAFRKVSKPWRYGTCAIVALLHDVLVVLGVFSILGWTLHIQVDSLFITALLTVVGFSVHDTIVVFDRTRENMQRRSSESFEQIVNASLVQTLSRSLNTSLTVLFTLSALTLFGGESIRVFTFALLIGIFSGTYSSIFNASMLLVIWERGELGLWRLSRDSRTPDGRRRETRERELVRSRG